MQDHGSHFVSGRQIDGGHGADALAVQYDIFGAYAVAGPKRLPGGVYVRVQITFARLTVADAVTGIIVAEYVTVDPHAQAQIEAAHLAQIHGVTVREQYGVTGVRTASDEYASDTVTAGRTGVEPLNVLHVAVGVLPFGYVVELDVVLALAALDGGEIVRGLRRQKRQFGGDT